MFIRVNIPPGKIRVNKAWGPSGNKKKPFRKLPKFSSAQSAIGQAANLNRGDTFRGLVEVFIHAVWANDGHVGDVDGPVKGILDALQQAEVFINDVQVVRVLATKAIAAPGEVPHVLVMARGCERAIPCLTPTLEMSETPGAHRPG